MTLEQQVCSLDLAKRLKELGVKQDSYFYWSNKMDGSRWRTENCQFFKIDKRSDVSAFTVAELGEMLPAVVNNYGWRVKKTEKKDKWEIKYRKLKNGEMTILRQNIADTEADSRAKMLVYLLENKLINL